MDRLGDIRLFVEAAELGSLSAAGRKLNLTPAAASARLAKLEAAVATRLFDRSTRRLRLTDEGRLYLNGCRQALQALEVVGHRHQVILQLRSRQQRHGGRGSVKVGCGGGFCLHRVSARGCQRRVFKGPKGCPRGRMHHGIFTPFSAGVDLEIAGERAVLPV